MRERERLYFVEHRHGNTVAKANGVTFEGGVPADREVYFSMSDFDLFPRSNDDSNSYGRSKYRRARKGTGGTSAV